MRARPLRDAALGERVAEQLRGEQGVSAVTPTSLTGSLLVEYDAQTVQLPWLVQLIVQLAGLAGLEADHKGPPQLTGPAIRDVLDRWNAQLVHSSRGRVDARLAVPGTLVGLGAAMLVFGRRRLPEWYDLMFWGFTMFVNLNPPTQTVVVKADGEPA